MSALKNHSIDIEREDGYNDKASMSITLYVVFGLFVTVSSQSSLDTSNTESRLVQTHLCSFANPLLLQLAELLALRSASNAYKHRWATAKCDKMQMQCVYYISKYFLVS